MPNSSWRTLRTPLLLALAGSLLLILAVMWALHIAEYRSGEPVERQLELVRLQQRILHLDEVLTMSARMAVTTGDERWVRRYAEFEPQLGTAIDQLVALAPDVVDEMMGEDTRKANDELVALETAAFEALEQGQQHLAHTLVMGRDYEAWKQVYAAGMHDVRHAMTRRLELDAAAVDRQVLEAVILVALGFVLVILSWLNFAFALRRHLRLREGARERISSLMEQNARQDAQGQFLAHMSHELRTPLTAILGEVQEEGGDIDTEARERIRHNAEHLLDQVDDILELAHDGSDSLPAVTDDIVPAALLERVARSLKAEAAAKGLALDCEVEADAPCCLRSDEELLRRVLLHLGKNAVAFTTHGGVTLGLGRRGSRLLLSVSDTGQGMSEAELQRALLAFAQADSTLRRQKGGLGVGLAVARRIVERLGGELRSESQVGRGSRFEILLGIERCAHEGQTAAAAPPRKKSRRPALSGRVLVVDDARDNRILIERLLSRRGLEVELAQNGAEALERFGEGNALFDLVVMDVQMPVIDGREAVRRLRASGHSMPVLFLTAHALEGERQRCLDVGGDEFLTKPIVPGRLHAVLDRHLPPAPD